MAMGNILRIFRRALPFLLVAVVILSVVFFPKEEQAPQQTQAVLRLWSVDTFEGGKGSRTAFLRRVSERFRQTAYVIVTNYTVEGAEAALKEGQAPDLLSFGVGLSAFADRFLPLPYRFSGGEADGETYAVPWCANEYLLFSRDAIPEKVEEEVIISSGSGNLACAAAHFAGLHGRETEPLAAYTAFLDGKARYLLGTRRDLFRFRVRGVTVQTRELPAYNDLLQYIAVLTPEKRELCLAFVALLLDGETKDSLEEIGMREVPSGPFFTPSVFADAAALARIRASAAAGEKNLDKFFKTV